MTANSHFFKYLPLPESFQSFALKAIESISTTVSSDTGQWASKFELPPECGPVVKQAQILYQKVQLCALKENDILIHTQELDLPECPPVICADGGVFKNIWKAGG